MRKGKFGLITMKLKSSKGARDTKVGRNTGGECQGAARACSSDANSADAAWLELAHTALLNYGAQTQPR